jgi:hypothetical protein
MKVAFVHYHLKTGGVTTVLRQQVNALQHSCDCLVLTGDVAGTRLPCKIVEIPELGYDRPGAADVNADSVANRVLGELKRQWPGGCDILHIHNPLIAKNRQLINIISRLQQCGMNLFLQLHDFAEDGRPLVYFADEYPIDCHYGVINGRDKKILQMAGLEDTGLHYLPNAIEPLLFAPCAHSNPLVLYPVRAIRRKNIGEAIVLSLFFPKGRRLAITQPPNSPADFLSYRDWVGWINDKCLPVDVEAGKSTAFPQLVGEADVMVTTSIAEGFGFSFLEPWTAGKWLFGRRLNGVCADFTANGIQLDGLYDRLDIPLDWIDRDLYLQCWREAVVNAADQYGYPITHTHLDQASSDLVQSERVDYGLLNERLQRMVGDRLIRDPGARKRLVTMNPWLDDPGVLRGRPDTIESNRQAVLDHYGLKQYKDRLLAIYDQVVRKRVRHRIDKSVVVEAFFDLDHFSLLQWGRYEP